MASSLCAVANGLRLPQFYLLLAIAVMIWALAYQNKRDYVVQIADLADHPYMLGFNDIEKPPPGAGGVPYRWSKGSPSIFLPGVGNEPVQLSITTVGSRPVGPPPQITLSVRGQTFKLQTQPSEQTNTYLVQRAEPLDGDFRLNISVPTFSTGTDPRELGVIIRQVAVRPADYGVRPVVIPPVGVLIELISGLVGTYFLVLVTARRRALAQMLVSANMAVTTLEIIVARPELGFHAGQLPSLWAWGIVFALLGRCFLDAVIHDRGRRAGFVAAAGSAAFALSFMARFGGLTYAQFLTSDIFLHIHNTTQEVMKGSLVFTEAVPDGTVVPYPPAYYLVVTALSWLVGNSDEMLGLILKWSASLFDPAACLGLAWAGWRLFRGWTGALAALVYACSPAVFDLFSAGNYTNLFAQSVFNLAMLGAIVFVARPSYRRRVLWLLLLWTGFCLTMLGHYGMMLAALAILGLFGIWTFYQWLLRKPVRESWELLGAGALALVGSFALYYWHFVSEISTQWLGVFGKLTDVAGSGGNSGRPGRLQSLNKLPGKVVTLLEPATVVTAAFGSALLSGLTSQARALLGSWLLATSVFAVLDQVVGDSIRWYYLGAVALALLGGRCLDVLLARRGWAGPLVLLILLTMAFYMLTFWIGLIFTRYH